MKKFLFTLAMLLMAGAAFADSYLYIDKADVLTGEQSVEVPVKAHFSEYVSAWQVTITLPDGINFDGQAEVGQDMTIPYFTDRGKTANYTLSLSQNGVGGFLAASQQAGFYKLNGTWTSHGAIKWAPGDYDEMIILYLKVTDAYTGGDIMITTEPMCGADPRDIPMAVVDGGRTLPWVDEAITAAEPTLAVDNEENPTQVTTNGVLYYCNETMTPGAWNIVTAPYTLPQATDVEQKLHFMAYTPNDEGKNDSKFVTLEVTIPAKAQNAPEPTITMDDNNYVVSAAVDGEDDPETAHTVKLYTVELDEEGNEVEGTRQEVTNPYAPQTYEEQKISFVAVTIAQGDETEDTECNPVTFIIPAKDKETVDAPTVEGKANDNAWQYNIVITPDPDGDGKLNYTVTDAEGNTVTPKETIVDEETGVVTLVFDKGNEAVTVHVEAYTAEGATCAPSETTKEDITIPALDKVAEPKITWKVNDDNTITITASCETEDATVVLKDPNGNVVDNPATVTYDPYAGYSQTWTATATLEHMQPNETSQLVTVDAINKKDATKPTIVGQKREGSKKLFDIIITPDANTDGRLVYDADPMGTVLGAKAEPVTIQYERGENDYPVAVTAKTLEGATYNESPLAEETIIVPKLDQVAEPVITYSVDGDQLTVTATCSTDGSSVVLVGPDGTEYENGTATVTFDPYKDYSETWTATASAEDMLDNSAEKKIEIAKIKVYEVPDPTITVDNSDPTKTVITIEATEGNLTYTLTEDDEPFTDYTVEVVDGKVVITIENGEEVKTVEVTATTTLTEAPEGYDEVKNGEAKKTVQTPVYVQPQTAKPTIDVSFAGEEGHYYANVTFKNDPADPNADIEYCLGDPTVEANWMPYTGAPVVITEDGSHTVYARATATGKATSEVADRTFELNQTATSVNELVNGKTVAGVRYFNMAGQEMQEANGITIVVTTYTDGTTSAVKVIK